MFRRRAFALFASFTLAGLGSIPAPPAAAATPVARLLCASGRPFCTEVLDAERVFGEDHYVGHDEPSVLFYSNKPGSGNSNQYRLTLPSDPPTLPRQDGTGGTFNFQLHPAFWFGMALCDSESSPEYTHDRCRPDSDSNIFDSADPNSPHYLGKHPGTAFMEMQFYAPGWVNWPPGDSCDATRWCAALNIDSLSLNLNTNVPNNADCLNTVGIEPVNFAFITKNGVAQAPANPVDATLATYTPDHARDLFMRSGDKLTVDLHDTEDGFRVVIHDLTTGQSGSMTAGIRNGFGQVIFDPNARKCSVRPYAFHPMYATSSERTRVVWAAHSYNVAFSDEIGHFEYCDAVNQQAGDCTNSGVYDKDATLSKAEDDVYCFAPPFGPPLQNTRIKIGGCFGTDADFDGVSYRRVWPGTSSNPAPDASLHPSSILFSSPRSNGQTFDRIAFEADLPRIELDTKPPCDRSTGANCVNPPVGSHFYPIYTTGMQGGHCIWQLGGTHIAGTTNTFGGTSTAEYGALLLTTYPGPGFMPTSRYNNFRQILANPCKS